MHSAFSFILILSLYTSSDGYLAKGKKTEMWCPLRTCCTEAAKNVKFAAEMRLHKTSSTKKTIVKLVFRVNTKPLDDYLVCWLITPWWSLLDIFNYQMTIEFNKLYTIDLWSFLVDFLASFSVVVGTISAYLLVKTTSTLPCWALCVHVGLCYPLCVIQGEKGIGLTFGIHIFSYPVCWILGNPPEYSWGSDRYWIWKILIG